MTDDPSDLRRSSDYRSNGRSKDSRDRDLERDIGRELSRFRDIRSDRDERRRSPDIRRGDAADPFGRDRDYYKERVRDNEHDKERIRDRYRSHDRDRYDRDSRNNQDWDRDRYDRDRQDRPGDFDGSKDYGRLRERDNDRDRDRDRDHDRDRGHDRDRDWDFDNRDRTGYSSRNWKRNDGYHSDEVVHLFLILGNNLHPVFDQI